MRASRLCPSMKAIERNVLPSASPISWTVQTLG